MATKLKAIENIPTENKLTASRVFNEYIREYEGGSGDTDPAAWFDRKTADINADLIIAGAGIIENAGAAAAAYYFDLP